jgi:hypothetical protein
LGHTGGAVRQQDGQQAAGDGEADALGLGDGGELGLAVIVGGEGVAQAPLQVVAAGLELIELLLEAEGVPAVRQGIEVVEDAVGLAVEGLAAQAVLPGASGDVAVAAEEDGAGAGEAVEQG